jgi:hypothetical protein
LRAQPAWIVSLLTQSTRPSRAFASASKAAAIFPAGMPVASKPLPTEQELVAAVEQYYAQGPDSSNYRKHVLVHLRRLYGPQGFGHFGLGTFIEFSARNGLKPVYP